MSEYDYEAEGEVIKMIHDELPAVRWVCGVCGEDTCTIFYETHALETLAECEHCRAVHLVRRPAAP